MSGSKPYRQRVLGQHFLAAPELAGRIVAALGPLEGAHVLEIGGGTGALTFSLAEQASALTVVEIDRVLAASLENRLRPWPQARVLRESILDFDFPAWAEGAAPLRPVVAGNIPYSITNALLHQLLAAHARLGTVVLMLQEEVARKLTAPAGSKPYGMLTALAAYHAAPEYLFPVGRKNFRPPPAVDSAVIRLDFARPLSERAADEKFFAQLVRRLFLDRRKQVQKILRSDPRFGLAAEDLEGLAGRLGLELSRRPEELPPAMLVRLADGLQELLRGRTD